MSRKADLGVFASTMVPAVRRASVLARSLEGRVRNCPKHDERTAVKQALTEADTAAQEVLLESLLQHYPGVSLAAEENTPSVSAFPAQGDTLVVIDPIDGTLHSYLEGAGPYSVMVGLVIKGRYEAAVVALPREGLILYCDRAGAAFEVTAGSQPRPAKVRADGDLVLVSHGLPARVRDRLHEHGLRTLAASGGAVAVAPLLRGVRAGVRYAGTLPAGISIRGRVGALIAQRAGATVEGDGRARFPLDLDTPTATLRVAADRGDLMLLDEALASLHETPT